VMEEFDPIGLAILKLLFISLGGCFCLEENKLLTRLDITEALVEI
jgi:hypothetical protein